MRVLVISDIHGNYDALKTVLEKSSKWDTVWVLGDLVDYGPQPGEVIDTIKDLKPEVLIIGNHDYAVAFNTDCRCSIELHDLSVYTRENISLKLLSEDQISWLKNLPKYIETEIDGKRAHITHGSPRSPLYGYLRPDLSDKEFEWQLTPENALTPRVISADMLFVGHVHVPMNIEKFGVKIFNPGSVGQPRDGDPRASYGIYDTENESFNVYRISYDIGSVIRKLKSLGLEEKHVKRLSSILRTGRIV